MKKMADSAHPILTVIIKIIKIFYYVITPVTAGLALYISIYGNPLAKPKIEPIIRDKCVLSQDYGALIMTIPFNFQNNGNKIGIISNIEISLVRIDSPFKKELRWGITPVSVYPSNYINLEIKFFEKLEPAVDNERFEHKNNALKESNKLFFDDPNKKIYKINDKLFDDIKKFVVTRLADFNYGKYILIIRGFERYNDKIPLFAKKYEFDISQYQIELLKKYQIESYRTHPQFNDKFFVYFIMPDLKEKNE